MTNDRACANDFVRLEAFAERESRLIQNWLRIKREAGDALVLMQMGDWFEAYSDDATAVAHILNVCLTRRGSFSDGTPIRMCAIPADSRFYRPGPSSVVFLGSTSPFIEALIRAGRGVVIATEQPGLPVTRKIEWRFWPTGAAGFTQSSLSDCRTNRLD